MKWMNIRSDLINALDQCYMVSKLFAFDELEINFLQHYLTKLVSSFRVWLITVCLYVREPNIAMQLPSDYYDVRLSL